MPTPALTLVIPARNSFPGIADCLDRVSQELHGRDVEILAIVNTAMSGPCARDVRNYRIANDSRVTLVELPNADKARAIAWAIEHVEDRSIGYVDADFGWEAPPGTLSEALDLIDCGASVVYGVRDLTEWSALRRRKTTYFGALANLLLRLGVEDSQAPAKFLSSGFVKTIRPYARLRGWEFDVELLWFARKLNFDLHPFPLKLHGKGGEQWWVSVLLILIMGSNMLVNLARFWIWTLWRGRAVVRTISEANGERR